MNACWSVVGVWRAGIDVRAVPGSYCPPLAQGAIVPPVVTQWHNRMAHLWRGNAGGLLAIYVLLGVAAFAAAAVAHPVLSCSASAKCWVPYDVQPTWLAVMGFLAWRVSRGGRVSRIWLIGWSALGYAAVAITIA